MAYASQKPFGSLLLLSLVLGCGQDPPKTNSEADARHPQAMTEVEQTDFSVVDEVREPTLVAPLPLESNVEKLPELLVPIPASEPIAPVQPASAVGLPIPHTLPENADVSPSDALTDLVKAYRGGQPEQWTRAEAAMHSQGAAALPALWEGLASTDRQTRELASMMLSQIVPNLLYAENPSQRIDGRSLATKLRRSLNDESSEVRANVAVALSLIEGEGPALVPILRELLASELPHVRTMAASALGGLGSPAVSAIPVLEKMSQTDSDPDAKTAILEALIQLRAIQ